MHILLMQENKSMFCLQRFPPETCHSLSIGYFTHVCVKRYSVYHNVNHCVLLITSSLLNLSLKMTLLLEKGSEKEAIWLWLTCCAS